MIESTWLQLLVLSQWALGVIVEWLLIALVVIALYRAAVRIVTALWRAYRRAVLRRREPDRWLRVTGALSVNDVRTLRDAVRDAPPPAPDTPGGRQ